jgi:hypothetical protein
VKLLNLATRDVVIMHQNLFVCCAIVHGGKVKLVTGSLSKKEKSKEKKSEIRVLYFTL